MSEPKSIDLNELFARLDAIAEAAESGKYLVRVASAMRLRDREPVVIMSIGATEIELEPDEAEQFGKQVMRCANMTKIDCYLFRFLTEIGMPSNMVNDVVSSWDEYLSEKQAEDGDAFTDIFGEKTATDLPNLPDRKDPNYKH
jgi:hypothetical protein